ncbi:MAG: hypothetical protein V3T27_04290 [Alphaproteobacteria bacterium]
MYIAGDYLFSGPDLDEVFEARKGAAREAIAALDADQMREAGEAELVESLVSRFQFPDPRMHWDKSYFLEERTLERGEAEAAGSSDAPIENAAEMKAITIAVPFEGDAVLFQCRPAIHSVHQLQADVVDQELRICFIVTEAEEWHLRHKFEQQIALIERQLEVTQWQVMGFNSELPEFVQGELRERRTRI